MNIVDVLYPRLIRPTALVVGLFAYVIFMWALWDAGVIGLPSGAYMQILGVWLLGFICLLAIPQRWVPFSPTALVLWRVLWSNLGVVAVAALVDHSVRVLLLVVPLYGVFYTALTLTRRHLLLVAFFTWLAYLCASIGMTLWSTANLQFEVLLLLGFTLTLAGAALLGWEALTLRKRLNGEAELLQGSVSTLREAAVRDELTGVHNRRFLMEVLQRQRAVVARGAQPFALCYCDLDRFKDINDQYGHAVGDAALRQFAQLAQTVIRQEDYVARSGGEEFVLVLQETSADAAEHVAQRLAAKTRQIWIPGTPRDYVLSVSIGIAEYMPSESVDGVMQRADQALYQAKAAGRDRVVRA